MIGLNTREAAILTAVGNRHHKTNNNQQRNHTNSFYNHNSPAGTVNILIGGAMIGTMIIFLLWMCYFCRCKIPKEDNSSYTSSSHPYWIDMRDDMELQERVAAFLQTAAGRLVISDVENAIEIPRRPVTPPPTYESVVNILPTYEDVAKKKENNEIKK